MAPLRGSTTLASVPPTSRPTDPGRISDGSASGQTATSGDGLGEAVALPDGAVEPLGDGLLERGAGGRSAAADRAQRGQVEGRDERVVGERR